VAEAEAAVRSGQEVKSANERTEFEREVEGPASGASYREERPLESTNSDETFACFNGKEPSGYLRCIQTPTQAHTCTVALATSQSHRILSNQCEHPRSLRHPLTCPRATMSCSEELFLTEAATERSRLCQPLPLHLHQQQQRLSRSWRPPKSRRGTGPLFAVSGKQ